MAPSTHGAYGSGEPRHRLRRGGGGCLQTSAAASRPRRGVCSVDADHVGARGLSGSTGRSPRRWSDAAEGLRGGGTIDLLPHSHRVGHRSAKDGRRQRHRLRRPALGFRRAGRPPNLWCSGMDCRAEASKRLRSVLPIRGLCRGPRRPRYQTDLQRRGGWGRQTIATSLANVLRPFFAAAFFFLGQQKVMPRSLHGSPLLTALATAPLAVMIFWLVRVRWTNRPLTETRA